MPRTLKKWQYISNQITELHRQAEEESDDTKRLALLDRAKALFPSMVKSNARERVCADCGMTTGWNKSAPYQCLTCITAQEVSYAGHDGTSGATVPRIGPTA